MTKKIPILVNTIQTLKKILHSTPDDAEIKFLLRIMPLHKDLTEKEEYYEEIILTDYNKSMPNALILEYEFTDSYSTTTTNSKIKTVKDFEEIIKDLQDTQEIWILSPYVDDELAIIAAEIIPPEIDQQVIGTTPYLVIQEGIPKVIFKCVLKHETTGDEQFEYA